MLSDEEFNNILAEMEKYHDMKKDIRHKFQKNKVKKTAEDVGARQLRRQIHAEILKKLAFEKDRHPKIEASCFCFLRSGDSGVEEQRPPPYNPGF